MEEKLPEWVLTLLLYTAVSYSATFFVDFAINLFVSWHAVRSVQKSHVPGSTLAVCLHHEALSLSDHDTFSFFHLLLQ